MQDAPEHQEGHRRCSTSAAPRCRPEGRRPTRDGGDCADDDEAERAVPAGNPVTMRAGPGDPLAWNVARPARPSRPAPTRDYAIAGVTHRPAARISGWPIRSRARSASPGRTAACSSRPTSSRASTRSAAAASARSRSRSRSDLEEEVLPSVDLATGQPLDATAEPEVAPPDRPSRARARDAGRARRSRSPSRSPPLCEPDCPGLCTDLRGAAGGRPARPCRRGDRSASRGAARRSGSTGRGRTGRLPPLGPTASRGSASALP